MRWTPVTSDAMTYLDIGSELTLRRRPFHDRMAFWDLFYATNKNSLKAYKEGDA